MGENVPEEERWKNLRQSESGKREGQRLRDGQGHLGNNKALKELGAAELGLGAGGASILITFLLGLWPVTDSAVPLPPTLIPLFLFSTCPPPPARNTHKNTSLPVQLGVESLSGWVGSAWWPQPTLELSCVQRWWFEGQQKLMAGL